MAPSSSPSLPHPHHPKLEPHPVLEFYRLFVFHREHVAVCSAHGQPVAARRLRPLFALPAADRERVLQIVTARCGPSFGHVTRITLLIHWRYRSLREFLKES